MSRKQLVILLALVVVIGAIGLLLHQRSQSSWQRGGQSLGQKVLPNLSVNDIAQFTIKSGTNELTLAKRDGRWRVRERGDYPAKFADISDLLIKLSELKIVQTDAIGPSQLSRFELLPPGPDTNTATQIELKDASGKSLATLRLGKVHFRKSSGASQFGGGEWPDGRYLQTGGDDKSVALVSDPLDQVRARPERWLNKDFLRVENPRTISVQFPESTNSWTLTRASESGEWELASATVGETLDSAKISGVTSPLSSPTFEDVTPATSDEVAGPTNAAVLTVETFDGFTYVARIGEKAADHHLVRFTINADLPAEQSAAGDESDEDKSKRSEEFKEKQKKLTDKLAKDKSFEGWVFSIPAYVLEPTLKQRNQLLAEEKQEADRPATPESPQPPEPGLSYEP